ncbi:MAG: hypothetical protein WCG23_02615 [bacterium]
MKKFFNIMFVLLAFLSCLGLREEATALSAGKMIVSPVNVPTVQSSYGVYPNTVDMIANDIINSINKYSSFDVPDLNSAKDLIKSYGLSKRYKEFLMNYRDNRVVDYETCNLIDKRLGVDKILLVSGGFDIQNMFLNRSGTNKNSSISAALIPVFRMFSKDLVAVMFPFYFYSQYKDSNLNEEPINPYYKLNVQLALIDTSTGLVVWEKSYNQDMPASDFGNPINSFGENIISSGKLKKFSENIAKETSFEVFMATKNSDYTSVKSSIVSSPEQTNNTVKAVDKNKKTSPADEKKIKVSPSSPSGNNYLENKRKESYKKWAKEQVKK